MKKLSQDGQCPDRDFNEAPPAYKSESLPLEPSHMVFICFQLFRTENWLFIYSDSLPVYESISVSCCVFG
jgi:hypothetical protein